MEKNVTKKNKIVAVICLSSFIGSILGVSLAPYVIKALRSVYEVPVWVDSVTVLAFVGLALMFALSLPKAIQVLRRHK